ncbi:hypothetical protein [Curtobacterium sp. MCPF17_031]|uniref:hypothetical protein n=1 Tax=Curtobacterium sp. MCPF17_031 TaxID=2175653 RepID=UPI000DA942FB|nr:hypothetical protein [Curtobacterium sp. MCPF17_031]PZE39743.1 hypothetical protein DEJ31_02705 [Curtobacterium sp. MCPF17_031]
MRHQLSCARCGRSFQAARSHAKFCTDSCRALASAERRTARKDQLAAELAALAATATDADTPEAIEALRTRLLAPDTSALIEPTLLGAMLALATLGIVQAKARG